MADTAVPPFRAEHVGSLLRPPALLRAREAHAAGQLPAAELRAAEDAAVVDAVRLQRDAGMRSVTDGEFRRATWHMDFLYALDGVSRSDEVLPIDFRNAEGAFEFRTPGLRVDGRLGVGTPIFADAFTFLRDAVTAADGTDRLVPKLSVPSPSMLHFRGGWAAVDEHVYADPDAYWADLSAAYAAQIRGIHDLGGRHVQLDDTSLAYLNDPEQRDRVAARGDDAEHLHERYVQGINAAIADRPADLRVTTHLCRGNFRSSWAAEGGYDFVAEAVFGGLQVDGFYLEYDDARSGDFAPLRYVRDDAYVVLGLVTTKRGELEGADDLRRRIDEAARYVPLDRLCLSPQCGFSSTVDGNDLTVEEQAAKLRLVAETAAAVWG